MATVRRKRKRTVATRKRIRHAIEQDEFDIADWMTTAPDDDKPGETAK